MEENIFKKIETEKKLPEGSKEELVSTIESAKLLKGFVKLFSTEYLSVLKDFFKTTK
jgi:hypothetical protein